MQVTNIVNHGTIVTVEFDSKVIVHMDHRMFWHFAEAQEYDFRNKEYETDGKTIWEE